MNREEALALLKQKVKNENLVKHIYAVEAVMRGLAKRFDEDEETWAMAGLLHDIDYEDTLNDPAAHGKLGAELLREKGVDEVIVNAVLAHADKAPRDTKINQCIFCADPVTGLVVAAALVRPDKKLAGVEVQNLKKRFKEKRFAAGADRDRIIACEQAGLPLEEFLGIALKSMQGIAAELGL